MNESLNQILTRLENEWLPAALELGIRITFWNSVGAIVTGLFFLAVAIVAPFIVRKVYLTLRAQEVKAYERDDVEFDDWDGWRQHTVIAVSAVCMFIMLFGFIAATINLFTIWNWIGIFDPQLRLAYDIYQTALKASK